MNSSLLSILPAVDGVLFNFAESDLFWENLAVAFGKSSGKVEILVNVLRLRYLECRLRVCGYQFRQKNKINHLP
ncbi:hypothetical protein MTo_04335 [Microcystis aeruginosa NIES-1211]|jgi:hypothetical protein|uniref:Uncharacterized protein n=1 Tax=Microcystis aeruginosa NIES-2519 TaxID=2303981 RepID=A0A5A5R4L3_MICAE|nr:MULTISPECIES: hypothetical protein [Microcystis]GBL17008.1 hypothetical protein MTo_04335 [Microcystis aeruginosa NIES-1211]GCA69605.1 hypothetical protein MiYa_01133 [Microcystis aeruginosa NIES-2519]GCA84678.1 hypothetical protein MiHa_02652 [Microcystis aeruginosa NIES-2522]GCA90944.1 hypothetical protein MiTa_04305 [Microcystis aeruginosa NIES-4264]